MKYSVVAEARCVCRVEAVEMSSMREHSCGKIANLHGRSNRFFYAVEPAELKDILVANKNVEILHPDGAVEIVLGGEHAVYKDALLSLRSPEPIAIYAEPWEPKRSSRKLEPKKRKK